MSASSWTQQAPTRAGFYWWKEPKHCGGFHRAVVAQVHNAVAGRMYARFAGKVYTIAALEGSLWCGPIEPPAFSESD